MALILVVDDSLDSLLVLKEFLIGHGYDCRLASSGRMAMELLSKENFDLLITDYQMDDGDGPWLLNELRHTMKTLKSIIITGNTDLSSEHLLGLGADAFCFKPLAWQNLKVKMDELLSVAVTKS